MSCSTSIKYGFGFDVDSILTTAKLNFILAHSETVIKEWAEKGNHLIDVLRKTNIESINNNENFDDVFCDSEYDELRNAIAECSFDEGLEANDIIAAIMTNETEIEFVYERAQTDECEGNPAIIVQEGMPWHFNDKEKNLTEDSLREIMAAYAKELEIQNVEIEYKKIEYFG